ncbi:hypothetical protein [Curtobacterium sp. 24E2]
MVEATMTSPTAEGDTPASARALRPASIAIDVTLSSGPAMWRVWIPVRVRIHSSLVSTMVESSSLVRMRSGWW